MKVLGVRLAPSHVGAFIGILYAYGAFLGTIGMAWSWLEDRGVPQLLWWQFLLAPFVIGATAVALEGLGTFLINGFAFDQTESKVRVELGKAVLVALLLVLVIGLPIYHMSQQ